MTEQEKPVYIRKKFLYGISIILFAVWFVLSVSDGSPSSQPVTESAPATSQKVSVGEEGYINTPSPKAMIALTEEGYKEITKIYLANDMMGVRDFLLSGKGFAVPTGTKVLVTDMAVGSRKVRVLEGDSLGSAGWIAMEWVSKTKN